MLSYTLGKAIIGSDCHADNVITILYIIINFNEEIEKIMSVDKVYIILHCQNMCECMCACFRQTKHVPHFHHHL